MDNPFKKIFATGKTIFQNTQPVSVVGVDIGTCSIKVAQLKKKNGQAVLETYGTLALGPYAGTDIGSITNLPPQKLAECLIDVLRETNVNTKDAVFSIPSASSLIFVIDLPEGVDEKQLGTIVPTEARKYIPVPISEVTLDWWAIPKRQVYEDVIDPNLEDKERQSKTQVLVVAIHNDAIAHYQDVIKRLSLTQTMFEIEIFSSIRSTLSHELSTVLLLDMGASKTKLTIVEGGVAMHFHVISRGAADITRSLSESLNIPFSRAEELKRQYGLQTGAPDKTIAEVAKITLDYIFAETNSVVLSYEKKYNNTVSKVVLSGGGCLMPGLKEYAMENFKSELSMADPFNKTEAPAFLQDILRQTGPEFAVAIGLALRKLS